MLAEKIIHVHFFLSYFKMEKLTRKKKPPLNEQTKPENTGEYMINC